MQLNSSTIVEINIHFQCQIKIDLRIPDLALQTIQSCAVVTSKPLLWDCTFSHLCIHPNSWKHLQETTLPLFLLVQIKVVRANKPFIVQCSLYLSPDVCLQRCSKSLNRDHFHTELVWRKEKKKSLRETIQPLLLSKHPAHSSCPAADLAVFHSAFSLTNVATYVG